MRAGRPALCWRQRFSRQWALTRRRRPAACAPKGTPEDVIATLNQAVNEIVATRAMQAQMVREGADPVGGIPAMLGQFTQKEFEKWRALVRESGATVE